MVMCKQRESKQMATSPAANNKEQTYGHHQQMQVEDDLQSSYQNNNNNQKFYDDLERPALLVRGSALGKEIRIREVDLRRACTFCGILGTIETLALLIAGPLILLSNQTPNPLLSFPTTAAIADARLPTDLSLLCGDYLAAHAAAPSDCNSSSSSSSDSAAVSGWQEMKPEEARNKKLRLKEVGEAMKVHRRTPFVTTLAGKYLDIVDNWFESLRRLGYGKHVIVIAEDETAYAHAKERWPLQTVAGWEELGGDQIKAQPGDGLTYGTQYFNEIATRRQHYWLELLKLNLSIATSDLDMVWLKDPFPYFVGDFDLWILEETQVYYNLRSVYTETKPVSYAGNIGNNTVCAGFLFLQPTKPTIELVETWLGVLDDHAKNNGGSAAIDQDELNGLLQAGKTTASIGLLPPEKFPSGCIFFKQGMCPDLRKKVLEDLGLEEFDPVMVHNNFITGHDNKVNRFKDEKLWLI